MPVFHLNPSLLEQAQRDHRTRQLRATFFTLPLLLLIPVPAYLLTGTVDRTLLAVLGIFGTFLMAQPWLTAGRVRARLEQHFESYRLEVDEEGLVQRSTLMPERRLARSEVARIRDIPGMGLVLAGRGAGLATVLPPYLDRPDAVRELLAAWAPLEQSSEREARRSTTLGGLLSLLAALGWVALWFGVGLFSDIRLAMASGAAMLAVDAWFLHFLAKNAAGIKRAPIVAMMVLAGLSVPARLVLHFWHG
ncbi:hypothetical protein FGE12_01850 [Aggregicoccus sp. 17bor-14]|uniref:hypothetical protein n=1 Tax=Myxococcaceae TaxID=31 RepID=UPI00129C46E3|nr:MULTISPECIES: hypothetical protein [Myxococcaceae]MBF5041120.1 hypothetical protein [Simulacricoccus sp. 17bor-14]MRI86907.1 hypothetical protein [Aggregicoccus sp. 17bor-14]